MKYRRALLLADLEADPGPALLALARVAPKLEQILIVAKVRALSALSPSEPDSPEVPEIEPWRRGAAALAATEVRLAPELPVDAIVELAITDDVDLLVAGAPKLESATLLSDAGRRLGVSVLWPSGAPRSTRIEHLLCAAVGRRSRLAIAAFLREHDDPNLNVSIVGPPSPPEGELEAVRALLGIHARVEVLPRTVRSVRAALGSASGPVDLVVLMRAPALLLLGYAWPAPVLLVPEEPMEAPARALDIADVIAAGRTLSLRVDEVGRPGLLSPAAGLHLAFVSEGQVVATAKTTPSGELELPAGTARSWLGAVRVPDDGPVDSLAALQLGFAVLRPEGRPLALFDAELPEDRLAALARAARVSGAAPLAVRLRPTRTVATIKKRLRAVGLAVHVVDARAVLREGDALDVVEANDPVRLRRVAAKMRAAGFEIAEPSSESPAPPIAGNRVEVELDNRRARNWLLDAIATSRRSLDLQSYMALDDEVGRAVEAALAAAGARGVKVRVLIDSLHGMHRSFGTENPLLSRLSGRAGVELRVGQPLRKVPSITDIKQRDHRKVVVADGRVALVGGRNLSHEYYSGFEEVPLSASSEWRRVPWLDAGARLEGPAVAVIHASFREAWVEASGTPFEIQAPEPVGSSSVQVVVHHGLRDANTLEAYLDLIEHARSHVYAVNGFPYVLELQHALLGALRRGVRVRVISGHLTPMHDGTPFGGAWSAARTTATEFVHSRFDPIVDAGGEVALFARREVGGWAPGLGVVHAHVHAKLMSADGLRCAVGSANFDVTSSYWESELMIVVEDPSVVRPLEGRLDEIIAGSTRVNADDPAWRERERRRAWMRRWPGVLAL